MSPEASLDADLALARSAVLEAGSAVADFFGGEQEVRMKGPGQPVTPADLAAEEILRLRLAGARPGYGWLSEESVDEPVRLERRHVWMVDPIDGTRSFISGRPEFAISVALVEAGEPVLGFVYNPVTGELFWAVRGAGAWLDALGSPPLEGGREGGPPARRRLAVRGAGASVLLASRSELRAGEFDPFQASWELLPTGSTAYKMARVAAGDGDAFVSRGPKNEWDVCGAHIVVEEAGGQVCDLKGRPIRYNRPDSRVYGIIASSAVAGPRILEEVRALEPHPRLTDPET
ncbi:MAG TPA: 3'(2'),5'-bisphosphate nucleotidase CysQ [Longimicrobiales bacterium]|nr:3'(2'),5'-bisphosphate nucleotidase CysQ [Longimicrobiales bacterium]